jgi:ATP phosphoribosyltransferase regulatory subunit
VIRPADTAAALARIAEVSGQRVDPPTLMPAEIILELSGEAVRSRLCTFADAAGRELCLRPDLTTPIAQQVASGDLPVARYHSSGPVYRLPPRGSEDPIEHQQIGFEWFGTGRSPQEDAEALLTAFEAAESGGADDVQVRFGDVALYHAITEALPFSGRWKDRLRRSFSRRKGPRELLADVGRSQPEIPQPVSDIASLSVGEATKAVQKVLSDMSFELVGERTAEDIAERLRDRAADKAPDSGTAAKLARYLGLEVPVSECVETLDAFARDAGVTFGGAFDAFRKRLDSIARLKPPFWRDAVFSAEAGRRFEYYDGFVFELARDPAFERPIVSGGRYDGLVSRLSSGRRKASAIGAALRVDRLQDPGGRR